MAPISREDWHASKPTRSKPLWPTSEKPSGYSYPAWTSTKPVGTKLTYVQHADGTSLRKRQPNHFLNLPHLSFPAAYALDMVPHGRPGEPAPRQLLLLDNESKMIHELHCQLYT